jgi:drug/metabolite transporter (DMT)-like permease
MPKKQAGIFLVLAAALISGFSIFINKFGVTGINPYVFTGFKNLLVAIFLLVLILASGRAISLKKLKTKDWVKLVLIGFLGGSLPFLLFFKGLTLTSAAQASFIHKSMFIIAAPLAVLILKERLNQNFFLGAMLVFAGNLFFFKINRLSFSPGDGLIFLATLLWAVESVFSKRVLKTLPSQTVAFGRMFFGALIIMTFLVTTGQFSQISQLTFKQTGWIFITSIPLLGYVTTWYAGLKLTGISLATSVLVLGAPTTALISGAFLIQNYSPWQTIGTILLFSGVMMIVNFKSFFSSRINVRT